jgi:hypothetical protein
MAQDPYGHRSDEGDASVAMWVGTISALCAALGPCSCYMTYLVAFPLGLYAVYAGFQSREGSGPTDSAGRSMAMAGMVSGAISAAIGGLILGFIAIYLIFIVLIGVLGAMGN